MRTLYEDQQRRRRSPTEELALLKKQMLILGASPAGNTLAGNWKTDDLNVNYWSLIRREMAAEEFLATPRTFHLSIDCFFTTLQGHHAALSNRFLEASLDGSVTNYVPFISTGVARFRCTHFSHLHMSGEISLPNGLGKKVWKFQLEEGGQRCKVQVRCSENEGTGVVFYMHRTSKLSSRRSVRNRTLKLSPRSVRASDSVAQLLHGTSGLPSIREDKDQRRGICCHFLGRRCRG